MNDILPPQKRPLSVTPPPRRPLGTPPVRQSVPLSQQQARVEPPMQPPRLEASPTPLLIEKPKRRSLKKRLWWCVGIIISLLILAGGGAYAWYAAALQPVAGTPANKIRVEVTTGSSLSDIGRVLEEKKLIRSQLAFTLYVRLSAPQAQLQAGVYSIAPSESTPQIVNHLLAGNVDQVSITFLPGATLAENRQKLIKAGYSETEVDAALNKTYDSPLFADKPASADLEGYIYGETYTFPVGASVEQVLERTFTEFYAKLDQYNLIAVFKDRGLNLYEAITLASIIQREVPHIEDQKQVAQVFFTRLSIDMELGSDVTYQYAAKKLGVTPSPSLDSPYNTRKYPGLPPGPIATPGLTALQAVAAPASGDYVYFLSGDDDITYFGRTNEEHEANIRDHCKVKCLLP